MKRLLQDYNDSFEEFKRHNQLFPVIMIPNGILTKQEATIDPLLRGLLTAKESTGMAMKILSGKPWNGHEVKKLKEATVTALSGNYKWQQDNQGTMSLIITIENFDASCYLSENAHVMVAFINYKDGKHYRHKEAAKIRPQSKEGKSSLTFDFPQLQAIPTGRIELDTYTRTARDENINKRFLRLKLLIWNY